MKRKTRLTILLVKSAIILGLFLLFNVANAQEVQVDTLSTCVTELQTRVTQNEKLKISGYIQPQFQYDDSVGAKSYADNNETNTLNGKVLDKYTNEPLVGVLVKYNNLETYTDLDGKFIINNFKYGTYINVELISYEKDSLLINDSNIEIKMNN